MACSNVIPLLLLLLCSSFKLTKSSTSSTNQGDLIILVLTPPSISSQNSSLSACRLAMDIAVTWFDSFNKSDSLLIKPTYREGSEFLRDFVSLVMQPSTTTTMTRMHRLAPILISVLQDVDEGVNKLSLGSLARIHGITLVDQSRSVSKNDFLLMAASNVALAKELGGWKRVAIIVDSRSSSITTGRFLNDVATQQGIDVTFLDVADDIPSRRGIKICTKELIRTESRIIFLHLHLSLLQNFLCYAFSQGLTGAKYVFISDANFPPRLIVESPLMNKGSTCSKWILQQQVNSFFFTGNFDGLRSAIPATTIGYDEKTFDDMFQQSFNHSSSFLNSSETPRDFEMRYRCYGVMLNAFAKLQRLDSRSIASYQPWNRSTFLNFTKTTDVLVDCQSDGCESRLLGSQTIFQQLSLNATMPVAVVSAWMDRRGSLRWSVTQLRNVTWSLGRAPADKSVVIRIQTSVNSYFRFVVFVLAALSTVANLVGCLVRSLIGNFGKISIKPSGCIILVGSILLNLGCGIELTIDLVSDEDVVTWCDARLIISCFGILTTNIGLLTKFLCFRRSFFHSDALKSQWATEISSCLIVFVPTALITALLLWANLVYLRQRRSEFVVDLGDNNYADQIIYLGGCRRTINEKLASVHAYVPYELGLVYWHTFIMLAVLAVSLETRRYWISSFMHDVTDGRIFVFVTYPTFFVVAMLLMQSPMKWPPAAQYVTSLWFLFFASLNPVILFGRMTPKLIKALKHWRCQHSATVIRSPSLSREPLSVADLNSMINSGGAASVTLPQEAMATLMSRSAFTPTLLFAQGISPTPDDDRTHQQLTRTKSAKTVRFVDSVTIL